MLLDLTLFPSIMQEVGAPSPKVYFGKDEPET